VRTLVLADSTRGSGTRPDGAAAMRARVEALAEEGPERFASLRAPRLVAATCTPDVAEAVRAEMARVRLPGYRAAAEFMAGSDTSSLLPGITTPTLVIVGEHDEVVGVAESELLARTIPGARLHIVRGAGHAALSERPTDVATAVLDFWRAAT
jgi:pimeloyl-ACP methyl ester carboxylesterase